METVTCHLMWAGAKEAANYSLTCKYSWKMIVLIWTSAILIKYFDYFWDRLWERGGGVVKGINLLIAGNEVVLLRNCSRRLCLNFPPSFLCPPVFDLLFWELSSFVCLLLVSPGSVPMPVPQDHNSLASSSREKPKWQGEGRASGREPGWLLSEPEPWLSNRLHSQNFQPRNSQLPAPTLGSPCKYQHKNHGSSCPEMGEVRGSWCNPEESGPPQQKATENFGQSRNNRTRCHCLSDSSLGVNKQQWQCIAEAMTRPGGAVETRKIFLAFYFVQDTKLSSGLAAGCLGLMGVSQGARGSLTSKSTQVETGCSQHWARVLGRASCSARAWLPSKPWATFQMSLLLPSEQLNRRCWAVEASNIFQWPWGQCFPASPAFQVSRSFVLNDSSVTLCGLGTVTCLRIQHKLNLLFLCHSWGTPQYPSVSFSTECLGSVPCFAHAQHQKSRQRGGAKILHLPGISCLEDVLLIYTWPNRQLALFWQYQNQLF